MGEEGQPEGGVRRQRGVAAGQPRGGGAAPGGETPGVGRSPGTVHGGRLRSGLRPGNTGGAGAFRDTLLSAVVSVTAVVVTCFGIAVVGHAGNDEHDGRTEEVLATATSRSRAFLSSGIVALGGATWLLLTTGVALALGVGNDTDHSFARCCCSISSRTRRRRRSIAWSWPSIRLRHESYSSHSLRARFHRRSSCPR